MTRGTGSASTVYPSRPFPQSRLWRPLVSASCARVSRSARAGAGGTAKHTRIDRHLPRDNRKQASPESPIVFDA
jgi:hypothetical protein